MVRGVGLFGTHVRKAHRVLLRVVGVTRPDPGPSGERREASHPDLAYQQPDWACERSTRVSENLGVGDRVTFTKEFTAEDVRRFAGISGDTNRLHLDDAFAEQTRFEGRIVHGTLLSGLISAALARLPGLTIYLSQDLEFLTPAHPGETLTTVCEVVEDVSERTYRLRTCVYNEADEVLIDGEAVVLVDDCPETDES